MEQKLKCFESLEYLCAYCLQREIRDNSKWASFALSNSMHARFNIYNGSHKKDKERTVNTQLQMRTIIISNTPFHSYHIFIRSSIFICTFIYAIINFSRGFSFNILLFYFLIFFGLKFRTPENAGFCRKNTFCSELFTAGKTIHF